MEVTKLSEADSVENPHGVDARPIYSHKHAQVIVLTLQPGESLRRHITPVDVFFYVLEGRGIVEVGEEKKEASKNTIIHSRESGPLLVQPVTETPTNYGG